MGIEVGMVVLDAGCGPGRLSIPIAKRISARGQLVAMDIQEGMLVRTKQKALAEGLSNIDFLKAGLGQGALGSNRFDAALLVTVLGEIPDRDKALNEIALALKPCGILSVTETVFDPHFQHRSTVSRRGACRIIAIFSHIKAFTKSKHSHIADIASINFWK